MTHDLTVTEEAVGDDGVMVEPCRACPAEAYPRSRKLRQVLAACRPAVWPCSMLSKPKPTKMITVMAMTTMVITHCAVTMDMMLVMGGMTTAHHPILAWIPNVNAHLYFGIYYTMTGLHGAHVIIGMIVIAWLFLRGMRGDFGANTSHQLILAACTGVVDLIWIFLFPLLYLV